MNKDYPRSARIGTQIQAIVSEVLIKKTKDPRLFGVSITDVKMNGDLSCAYVYFAVTGANEKKIKEVQSGFKSAKGFFKKVIGTEIKLRYTPDLKFYYDSVLDQGQKMDELLRSLNKAENRPENGEENP
ncbi:MAG: 30S ribosome-binding factor RbfA [Desulforegulaceae bacterium]|nr:30S ribosome-binding factor RbfA [Desulforegulaceae bacterium]